MINTAAIALTATGTMWITSANWYGAILIVFGVLLEWFKYVGRGKWW